MDSDSTSVDIDYHENWERRRARLIALESVNSSPRQVVFKFCMNQELQATAEEGNVQKFIEALKKYSVSKILEMRGPSGNSLLHVAAGIMEAGILQALLEVIRAKPLINEVNHRQDTALHIAARAGSICTAKLLLDYGSNLDMANDTGNTPLHEAVKNRHHELTSLLLSRGSISMYKENKESKSPLYLAIEKKDMKNFMLLMGAVEGHEGFGSRMEGMSLVHGAVIHRRTDMLTEILNRKKELFYIKDANGTPLHLAVSLNYKDEVKFLVDKFFPSVFEGDEEGYLPIHIACKMGHVEIIKKLLPLWQNLDELLTLKEGQNILHVAAKYGKDSVVAHMLNLPKLDKLINVKDKEGNTPLHVATLNSRYEVIVLLALVPEVDLLLVNNDNSTALDIAHEGRKTNRVKEEMIYATLKSVGARRSVYNEICQPRGSEPMENLGDRHLDRLKDVTNNRMLVATLIAGMTFAAGFSVPGGYNGSGPDAGFSTLLNKPMYDVFMVCNTIGLYSSIIAIAILHWVETSNLDKMVRNLRNARASVIIALAATSMAYMTGVYVTVSKRAWLAIVALIVGIIALFIIFSLHIILSPGNLYKFYRVEMLTARKLISFTRSRIKRRANQLLVRKARQQATAT